MTRSRTPGHVLVVIKHNRHTKGGVLYLFKINKMATITYSAQDTQQLLAVPGDNICRTNLMAGND